MMMRAADYIIDMGPLASHLGGSSGGWKLSGTHCQQRKFNW
jgi:excinuclease UvrABC ATPase subunit